MPVYYRLIHEEIAKQASKTLIPKVDKIIEKEFKKKKRDLMQNFDNHEVTQEIEEGAEASSKFLKVGNLFSLLGFFADEKPIEALREILETDIYLDKSSKVINHDKTIEIQKQVWMPSQDDIKEKASLATPLAWTSRSWIDLIERGITGFPWFLSNLDWQSEERTRPNLKTSRSGTGIEVKTNLGHGALGPIKYISGLMSKFRKSILNR